MSISLVHHLLERSALRDANAICLIDEGTTTYGEIDAAADKLAVLLHGEGLRRGDRVALLAINSCFHVECTFGILKAGGVSVPLNNAATPDDLAYYVADCGARILVVGRGMERVVRAAMPRLSGIQLLLSEGGLDIGACSQTRVIAIERGTGEARKLRADLDGDDLAYIVYTSGSTGRPRGVMLTHTNCLTNALSVVRYLQLSAQDRVMAVLPFYYIYGQSVLNTHIAVGGSLVIENGFLYPQRVLDRMERERCTGFSGVPSSFAILLNRSNLAERSWEHLRYVTQAGGAMSPALIRRLIDALGSTDIFIMYGATEAAGRLSYLPAQDLQDNIGSIGKAIDGVELRVLRPDGTQADIGETGEIVASGACIMKGYWGAPDATAQVLDGSGYHTGDLARREANGYLTIVGRKGEMIKAGAHRISAREIENAIAEHPKVHEVAVVGVPDEQLGEAILAHVVPSSRDDPPDDLPAFLRARLPRYKLPARIVLQEALPKNESGKIMKTALRGEPK
jgi:acyl-CoA synthetase (AMP-forming)/AMP-acid ligase II